MPTRPTPSTGAPTSEPTAVPCSPPNPAGSWSFSVSVFGRPRKSGWVTSMPESTIVTGRPGGGGVSVSTPTAVRHHSVATSGSEKSATASVPAGRFGAAEAEGSTGAQRADEPARGAVRDEIEPERRCDERAACAGDGGGLGAACGRAELDERRAGAGCGPAAAGATAQVATSAAATTTGRMRMAELYVQPRTRVVRRV